jgi:hypothetical protein
VGQDVTPNSNLAGASLILYFNLLGGGFDLETGILESHFCEANYLLRDKRQASSIIYSFGKVRDKNLSISCLDPETCTKCVPNHVMS